MGPKCKVPLNLGHQQTCKLEVKLKFVRGNLATSVSVLGFASGLSSQPAGITDSGNQKNSAAVAREFHFSKPPNDLIYKQERGESVKGTHRHARVDVYVIRSFALAASGYVHFLVCVAYMVVHILRFPAFIISSPILPKF